MMMWKNWVNAVIGLWFIIAPWALGFSDKTAAVWTSVIFGLVQLIASAWAATMRTTLDGRVAELGLDIRN